MENVKTTDKERLMISKGEYEYLIRTAERFGLLENYIMNSEYHSSDTLRALVGYAGGSDE